MTELIAFCYAVTRNAVTRATISITKTARSVPVATTRIRQQAPSVNFAEKIAFYLIGTEAQTTAHNGSQ